MRSEIARHAPEVPDRGIAFRGDEVDHDARCLVLCLGVVAALAGMRYTHFDQHMARWGETADLPAVHRYIVGQAVATQGHAPERRRHDVFHVPGGDHFVAGDGGHRRCLVDLLLADAGRVHIGFMGEVHEVVDHQAVVATDVEQPAAVGPLIIHRPFQMRNQRRVGLRLVAGPDPDEAIALDGRKGLVAGEATHPLARHRHGLAVATHHQAVVAAHQVAVLDIAQRQRCAAVRAEVLDGGYLVLSGAVEHDFFPADLPAQGFGGDFVGGAGDVPGVFRVHGRLSGFCFYLMDPLRLRWAC
ncbi:hypothetical protein D3C76_142030 [compost metagenome]